MKRYIFYVGLTQNEAGFRILYNSGEKRRCRRLFACPINCNSAATPRGWSRFSDEDYLGFGVSVHRKV